MNQQHYRIVFNKARGQYMAVAETAKAQGKSSGNTAKRRIVQGALLGLLGLNATLNPLLMQMAQAQIASDPAAPGNQRPTVLAAPNGVPVVNIQTPSAAGVSRNTYSQFDVNQNGAILNNSRSNVQSQLGGWIQGNPWMAKDEARIILNEVNSANPSQIKGYVEIAGQRAELVIANPAGINVDGGGFINASRAVLTTGTPQMGAGGSLDGYRVERGTVTINGKGLDASLVDYTSILARAAQVNAGIWAKDLAVITGENTVSASAGQNGATDLQERRQGGAGQPQFAIDVSQLGGMYAGKITMVGTEAGVGVRNAGAIGASAGQVQLSADGILTNSGSISTTGAGQNVVIDTRGRGLTNSGTIASQSHVHMVDNGATRNSGTINAARELQIKAGPLDNSQGQMRAARLDIAATELTNTNGSIAQTGNQDLSITAQSVANGAVNGQSGVIGALPLAQSGTGSGTGGTGSSTVEAPSTAGGGTTAEIITTPVVALEPGRISISGSATNAGGQITANGQTDLTVFQRLRNSGTIQVRTANATGTLDNSGGRLEAQSLQNALSHFANHEGRISIQDDLHINAQNLDNSKGAIATAGTLNAQVQQSIVNTGGVLAAEGDVTLASLEIDNSALDGLGGAITSNTGNLLLQAADIGNRGGIIQSVSTAMDKTLTIKTERMDNSGGKIVQNSNGTTGLSAADSINNTGGLIGSNGALALQSGMLSNGGGSITAQRSIDAHVGSLNNDAGKLLAQSALNLDSTGAVSNSHGQIGANDALKLASSSLSNDSNGQISSANGMVDITTGSLNNQSGTIAGLAGIGLSTQALENGAGRIEGGAIAIDTHAYQLANKGGRIAASKGKVDILSGALINQGGNIQAATELAVDTRGQMLDNTLTGTLASIGDLNIATGSLDNSTGAIQAGGTVAATATEAARTVQSDIRIDASGVVKNVQGKVQASQDVALHAHSLDNAQGDIRAGRALNVTVADMLTNTSGNLLANDPVQLVSAALRNDQGGRIGSANSSVAIATGNLDNQSGTIAAKTDVNLSTQALANSEGLISGSTVSLDTHLQGLTNDAGQISSTVGALAVQSGALSNLGGTIISAQDLRIDVHDQTVNNQAGQLKALGNIEVTGHSLDNTAGSLQAGGTVPATSTTPAQTFESDVTLRTVGEVRNVQGAIQASRDVSVLAQSIDNARGEIQAGNALTATTAAAIRNTAGQIKAGETVQLTSGSLDNTQQGRIGSVNANVAISTGEVNNQGGVVSAKTDAALSTTVFNNTDGYVGAETVTIDAHQQRFINTHGQVVAGTGALDIQSGAFANQGGLVQAATSMLLDVHGQTLTNTESGTSAGLLAGSAMTLRTGAIDNSTGVMQVGASGASGADLSIVANGTLGNTLGRIQATRDIGITAQGMDNTQGQIQSGNVQNLAITDAVNNAAGQLLANNALTLNSASLNNTQHGVIGSAAGSVRINTGALSNRDSEILAGTDVSLSSQALDNTQGVVAGNNVAIDTHQQQLSNDGGKILAQVGALQLQSGNLTNKQGTVYGRDLVDARVSGGLDNETGMITTQGNSSLIVEGVVNNRSGLVQSGGSTRITTSEQLSNQGGQILANGTVTLQAAALDNSAQGQIGSTGSQVTLSTGVFNNNAGTVRANGILSVDSAALDNTAGYLGGQSLSVQTHRSPLNNDQGALIAASGSADIQAGATSNRSGQIVATDALHLQSSTLDNASGSIGAVQGDLRIDATGALNNQGGKILAGQAGGTQTLTVNASALDNSGSGIINLASNGSTRASVTGNVNNQDGTLASAGRLDLTGGMLDNRNGQIGAVSATNIQISSDLDNRQGLIQNSGAGALSIATGGMLNNGAGRLMSTGDAQLSASRLINDGGTISALGNLQVQSSATASNRQGLIVGNQDVILSAASDIDNTQGTFASVQGPLAVHTPASLNNSEGKILGGSALLLDTGSLLNAKGTIASRNIEMDTHGAAWSNQEGALIASGDLSLKTGALNNRAGLLQAGGNLQIDSQGAAIDNSQTVATLSNSGGIVADGHLTIHGGALNNQAGLIMGQQGIVLQTSSVDNAAGKVGSSAGSLQANTSGWNNDGGQVQVVQDLSIQAGAGAISNTAGLLRAGRDVQLGANQVVNNNTQQTDTGIEAGQNLGINAGTVSNAQGAIRANGDLLLNSSGSIDNSAGLMSGTTVSLLDPSATRSLDIINSGGTIVSDRLTAVQARSLGGDGRVLSAGDVSLQLSNDLKNTGEISAGNNASIGTSGSIQNSGKLNAGSHLSVVAATIDNAASGEMAGSKTTLQSTNLFNRGLIDGSDTQIDAGSLTNIGSGRIYGDHLSIAANSLVNSTENGLAGTLAARQQLDLGVKQATNLEHALMFSAGNLNIGGSLDADRVATGRADAITNASATIESLGDMSIGANRIDNLNWHFSTRLADKGSQTMQEYTLAAGDVYSATDKVTRHPASNINIWICDGDGTVAWATRCATALSTGDTSDSFVRYDYTRSIQESEIATSDPGRILSGGTMKLFASNILNDNSQILAGGALNTNGISIQNTETPGERITTDAGTATSTWRRRQKKLDTSDEKSSEYGPVSTVESISISDSQVKEYTAIAGSGTKLASVTASPASQTAAKAGTVTAESAGYASPVPTAVANAAGAIGQDGLTFSGSGTSPALGVAGSNVDSAPQATIANNTQAGVAQQVTITHQAAGTATENASVAVTAGSSALAQVNPITQVAVNQNGANGMVVRTSTPTAQLPNASLFSINPNSANSYLVETDPRFASYRQWLSSDYMLQALSLDPARIQKRLGDGFYEQRLIREQVAQLTGQRFLGDYRSDDEQYKALMNAGVTYAQTHEGLRPGVALTPEQMAQLTADIVWLVERDVMLADGQHAKTLVPQVYVRTRPGDINGSGSLLAGSETNLNLSGDLVNGGTIAGRKVVRLTAENIQNLGGRIHADTTSVTARNDLNNLGGTISANTALQALAGRDINLQTLTRSANSTVGSNSFARTIIDRLSGLYVTGDGAEGKGTLVASAGRDLNLMGAIVANNGKDGGTLLKAGRDLNLQAVQTASSNRIVWDSRNYRNDAYTQSVGSQVAGAGNVSLQAGNDLSAKAAEVRAGGNLSASADRDLLLTTADNIGKLDEAHFHKSNSSLVTTRSLSTHDQVGRADATGSIFAGNNVLLKAGNDLTVQGSRVNAKQDAILTAGNDVSIIAATNAIAEQHDRQETKSSSTFGKVLAAASFLTGTGVGLIQAVKLLGKERTTEASDGRTATPVSSTVEAASLAIAAGRDVTVAGSTVVADKDVAIQAARDLSIVPASGANEQQNHTEHVKSGLLGTVFQPSIGRAKTTTDSKDKQADAVGASIGSLGGNVTLQAGRDYLQRGSVVLAPKGDITIVGKNVDIEAARQPYSSEYAYSFEQKAVSASLNVPVVTAMQKAAASAKTVNQSKSDRVNAMAAVNTAWDSYQAAQAIGDMAQNGVSSGVSVSITYGEQKNTQHSQSQGERLLPNAVKGGGTVTVAATGAGKDSNLNVVGSDIAGKQGTTLYADNQVNLLAADQNSSERSENKSAGWNAGVAISFGDGVSLGVTAGGNAGKGQGNGNSTTWRNTHVGDASSQTTIASGDALTLKGAQVTGSGIDVAAKSLHIESLQDTAANKASQQNISGQVTVGYGFSASGSYSQSKINNDYASVNEQSGLLAGDQGYRVQVQDHAQLVGGLITSTQAAEDAGRNWMQSGTLAASNLANRANYSGSSLGVSGGYSTNGGDSTPKEVGGIALTPQGGKSPTGEAQSGSASKAIGYGKDSDSQNSSTRSGINTARLSITNPEAQLQTTGKTVEQTLADVRTTVTTEAAAGQAGSLQDRFDKQAVQKELDLQRTVTQEFDTNRQQAKAELNKGIDQAKAERDAGQITQEQYEEKVARLQNAGVLLDSVAAGLYTPSTSAAGSVVAAASPMLAQQIGDYFKEKAVLNPLLGNTQAIGLTSEQAATHALAHGVLAAAVAAATGNPTISAAISAAGAEAAAPALASWLYGKEDISSLDAGQKATISAVLGLTGAATGATSGGGATDIAASSGLAQNAVENNSVAGDWLRSKLNETQKFFGTEGQAKNTLDMLRRAAVKTAFGAADGMVGSADYVNDSLNAVVYCLGLTPTLCQQAQATVDPKSREIFDVAKKALDGKTYVALLNTVQAAGSGNLQAQEAVVVFFGSMANKKPNVKALEKYGIKAANSGRVIEGAIPNAQKAVIDPQKITSYALDSAHPVGGNKAKVFDSALGYNQSNAGDLMAKIQDGVRTNPGVLGKSDQFGQRFTVDMPITGPNGNTATVRTGWIIDPGSTTPRLTTLYVK